MKILLIIRNKSSVECRKQFFALIEIKKLLARIVTETWIQVKFRKELKRIFLSSTFLQNQTILLEDSFQHFTQFEQQPEILLCHGMKGYNMYTSITPQSTSK